MPTDIVAQLLRATAYPHEVGAIQLRETHISWVFLTGDWAYKIKKPRDLGFLDFSTLAARKHFCEEELRLNRRFAADLYVDVVPVQRRQDGSLGLGGSGQIVDYAVKMRQFDDAELLCHIAEREGLSQELTRELGELLARTHASLETLYPRSGAGTPLALQDAMGQNFEQIAAYCHDESLKQTLAGIARWFNHRIADRMSAMIRRISRGFVKDCHGDLHLGNIARIDGVLRFFDCIEFNDSFRMMDTIAEVAFLVMDCQARGLQAESMRLLNDYLEYSGDYEGLALLDCYRCYYAMVRAKVNLMRLESRDTNIAATEAYREFLRYTQLAANYTQPQRGFLAITFGVSGSGKSTVALQLLERTGAIRIRSDVERKRLFDLAPESSSSSSVPGGIYTSEASRRTFERLQQLARSVLQSGLPCIVDATFLRREQRKPFEQLAAELALPFLIIHCAAKTSSLRQRIEYRNRQTRDASEADVAIMEQQLCAVEALTAGEAACAIEVNENTTIDEVVGQITARLQVGP